MTYRLAILTDPTTLRNVSVIMYPKGRGKYAPATRKGLLLVASCSTGFYNDVSACTPCAWNMSEIYTRKSVKSEGIL